jgi:hypothetical protein
VARGLPLRRRVGGRTFATAELTAATLSEVDLSLMFGLG